MSKEKMLLSLIKDHLIYARLINGFHAIGLDPHDFYLNLSDTIFRLAGFVGQSEHEEILFSAYLTITEKINTYDVSHWREEVEPLAIEAYSILITNITNCN
jgi:hypothetical protein